MDAFESIVARILEKDGYWVRQSVKVHCSPDEKATFGPRTIPTPEIDLVAFNGFELILFEVKSFLDSDGVLYDDVVGEGSDSKKYKIINNVTYQELMSRKVIQEFGLTDAARMVKYGLAAGNIWPADEQRIIDHFANNHSLKLLTPAFLADRVISLGDSVYVNDEIWMTIKLLSNQKKIVK